MNLMEGLIEELNRNRTLLEIYKSIPEGVYGATMIERDIQESEKAIGTGDVVKMLSCFQRLKENK